jgi:hypothetical protein
MSYDFGDEFHSKERGLLLLSSADDGEGRCVYFRRRAPFVSTTYTEIAADPPPMIRPVGFLFFAGTFE